jgi:hypothetical protein
MNSEIAAEHVAPDRRTVPFDAEMLELVTATTSTSSKWGARKDCRSCSCTEGLAAVANCIIVSCSIRIDSARSCSINAAQAGAGPI